MFHGAERERGPGEVVFHPMRAEEYNVPNSFGGVNLSQQLGARPRHLTFRCGACGHSTNGRVLCDLTRANDGAMVSWCVCSCDQCEPSVIVEKDGHVVKQVPLAREYHAGKDWPTDLASLYEEASAAYSAGAFTAAGMTCRKILMACACDKGADDGKNFAEYVEYITNHVLTFPDAKPAIDKIRGIGNEANHKVQFVNQGDAERAMKIVTYMLNTIYSLPVA